MADTDTLLNDDNDDLDREVESCLTGAGHGVSSPSSCSFYSDQGDSSDSASFYSTATGHESTQSDTDSFYSTGTLVNDSDTASFYSTGTMVMSDGEDTLSFCSVDTLTGARDTEDERDAEEEAGDHATDDSTPPQALAGASVTGSRESLSSDDGGESVSSEVSVAGQLNRRLGLLLGYNDVSALSLEQDSSGSGGGLTANIMGYEIICGAGDKHTVYKIRVTCPNALLGTWYIHRRYSDFWRLRKKLIKEFQSQVSSIAFPPKRWVGSNLEPAFLGRRLACLQVFLGSLLETKETYQHPSLISFLCLETPTCSDDVTQENKRAICDTLEEAVKELREQLKKREALEKEMEKIKNENLEKDSEIASLRKENLLLKQQKESLMTALSNGRRRVASSNNSSTSAEDYKERRIETLEDFTARFSLKSCVASSSSTTNNKK